MDRKSFFILLICFSLLMLWQPLVNKLFPPIPIPANTNNIPALTNIASPPSPLAVEPSPTISAADPLPDVKPDNNGPEETVVLENENARYTFSSLGGGLKRVELKKHAANVICDKTQIESTNRATLNAPAPIAALAILAGDILRHDSGFKMSQTNDSVRAEKLLPGGLRIIKLFQLSTNFLLQASVRIENTAAQAAGLPAQEWVIGTATPIGLQDESLNMGVQWYNGSSAEFIDESRFANRALGCFPGTPLTHLAAGNSNVVWAAVNNQFFAMATIPDTAAPSLIARKIDLPSGQDPSTENPKKPLPQHGYQAGLQYPAITLQPNESIERRFSIYAGPKEYNTLARLGGDLELDLIMNFGKYFGIFAKALLLSMNGLYYWGLQYGWAIVVITIIIKLVFWPLTNASTKSMKRMAALQPQMKALQEKYKDDPKKMNLKLMEFMRENRVSPLGGCLPMLLQIPVFIGFYTMLQSAIELRGARFLWACDLSRPDTVADLGFLGFNFPINPMPLLMGVTMLWQARLTPAAPGMDPVQQKIMKYMPLIFMVFLYNFSAGLTLYWTVQNLLTIAQMKLTRSTDIRPAAVQAPPAARSIPPKKKKP